jgi:hypothetical protein
LVDLEGFRSPKGRIGAHGISRLIECLNGRVSPEVGHPSGKYSWTDEASCALELSVGEDIVRERRLWIANCRYSIRKDRQALPTLLRMKTTREYHMVMHINVTWNDCLSSEI